jgi:hypothetical protein
VANCLQCGVDLDGKKGLCTGCRSDADQVAEEEKQRVVAQDRVTAQENRVRSAIAVGVLLGILALGGVHAMIGPFGLYWYALAGAMGGIVAKVLTVKRT